MINSIAYFTTVTGKTIIDTNVAASKLPNISTPNLPGMLIKKAKMAANIR